MPPTHSAIGLVAAIASSFLLTASVRAQDAHAGHAAGPVNPKPAASPKAAVNPKPAASPKPDTALVTSAMSAAPAAVAKGSKIVAMEADGSMRTIRDGSNGFTCMPDNPVTPGPDPMCMDAPAMEWAMAWATQKPPPQKTGFMYMLAGGTDASNTDPFAKKPDAGNHWVKTGPHVMIVGDAEILAHYSSKPDPDTTQPYVMWAGTPYAHLMIPVR